jgi:hypothetical protein
MRKFRTVHVLFLLLVVPELVWAAGPARRLTARQLARTVDSALAGVAQAAEDPAAGLDRAAPGTAAFRGALGGMRLRVSRIESALERRDGEFFLLVDQGSADLGALRVSWARTGARNDTIAQGLRLASASYRLLRSHFGREGLRYRQGGGLTEAEKRQFQRLQRANQRFAESLRPLRERAERRGDPTTVAELDRFRAEAERIAWERLALETYLNALIAASEMRGEWEANAPYLRDDGPEELAAATERVHDLYVESDIGHVFTVDLGASGWPPMEQEAEIPQELQAVSGAVQVFQLVEGEEPAPEETVAGPESESLAAEDAEEIGADEEIDPESADPEGLEEAAELDDEILEEEDLGVEEEGAGAEVEAAGPPEKAAEPQAGSPAAEGSPSPAPPTAPPPPGPIG